MNQSESGAAADIFDLRFPPHERLPRQFDVTFSAACAEGSQGRVTLVHNGVAVGDVLTDNAESDDGYRFHDAFHLTHAAYLGWSPVARKLFRCKRKSDMSFHNVEDSGRATVTEEGICVLVHAFAVENELFQNGMPLPVELLRMVLRMADRLEVRRRSARDWEESIVRGYAIWLQLRKYGGGVVRGDLYRRSVAFSTTGSQ